MPAAMRLLPDDMETAEPLTSRLRKPPSDDLDITPMIDCVFLLLIYFLVTSISADPSAVELPKARHGVAVSQHSAVVISVAEAGSESEVYLADGKVGAPLPTDPAQQQQLIREAVRQGLLVGRRNVLIKAEPGVHHRDVSRVAAAAGELEGVTINLAVLETD